MVRRIRSCSVRLARGLVDRGAQATGELDRVIVGPEVHEDQPRLLGQHVAVIAVTSMPVACSALMTGLTSVPISTKSPVIAALPPPVG